MYPILRTFSTLAQAKRAGPSDSPFETVVSHLRVWPWDIDMFLELNNGRTLTLYDLGRNALAQRMGLLAALRRNGWGLVVAGASVRYRNRVFAFQKVEIRTRAIGWDDRWIYLEQSMWRGDTPCSHLLIRTAVTGPGGVVPTSEVKAALGGTWEVPELPDWAQAWAEADGTRPWPPEI